MYRSQILLADQLYKNLREIKDQFLPYFCTPFKINLSSSFENFPT